MIYFATITFREPVESPHAEDRGGLSVFFIANDNLLIAKDGDTVSLVRPDATTIVTPWANVKFAKALEEKATHASPTKVNARGPTEK
jgi:hypothetical protein